MALIGVKDIYKTYNLGQVEVPVLRGVSMSVEKGEFIALMGVSGSGKTTLMNILGCLDRPSAGHYYLDGEDVSELPPDRRAVIRNKNIGFVFQNFNLLSRTNALENVMMPLSYAVDYITEKEAGERAETLLALVGLKDRMRHEPTQLSGGQQQRVAIARALINRPPILFADEPTGNLDSRTSAEILDIFRDLHERENLTVILVTHDPEIASHADRIVHIRDGRIQDEECRRS